MSATHTQKLHIIKVQPTDYFISDTFNNILDDIDSKVLGINHLQTALHWTEWEENTTYTPNDVVRWPNMKSHQYAKCISGGTSGGIEPGNNVTGSVLTEGSVTWKVMSLTEATDNSAAIMIWLGGEIYSRGDVVIYANALYRATVNHTASGTFGSDKAKWQEIYASIRPWIMNKFYYEDDTVIVDNVIYRCNEDHTALATFTNVGEVPYWDIVGNLARASEWHSVTPYLKDQLITKNGLLYRALETHTSSGVFTDDTLKWEPVFASIIPWTSNAWYDQDTVVYYDNVLYRCIDPHVSSANFDYSKWVLLHDPNGFIRDWVGSTHYYQYQLVRYDGNVYRCNTANNDANFTIAKWDLLTDSINDWVGSSYYVVGQYVNYNGILYKCITANNDANFTISKWQKVSGGGIDSWSANTDYIVGDVVVYANKIYQCNTSHTSQSTFTPDASKWTEISACITRIPDWLASTDYVVGDLVAHDAKIYRCTTAHTSGNMWNSTEESNWEELSPTINEISDWAVSTDYAVGQLVIHNDKLYRCNTAHTSDSASFNTDIAYWDAISDSGGIETWAANEPYSQGNMVVYNDKIYVCDAAHTSTSTFDPTKWHEVSTGDIKLWASSTDYSVGNDVIYQNKLYRCTIAHTSTSTFDVTKWEEISSTKLNDWQASTEYAIGDYVVNSNKIYKCTTAHTSTSTFDKSKWAEISSYDIELWQPSTDYIVGNLVIQDDKIYRCKTVHTSSSAFNSDIVNWDILDTKWQAKDWASNTYYLEGEVVLYNNTPYKCITAHTSLGTFELDKADWEPLSANIREWVSGNTYKVGDTVLYENEIWKCITVNNSNSFEKDKWSKLNKCNIEMWRGAPDPDILALLHFNDRDDLGRNEYGASFIVTDEPDYISAKFNGGVNLKSNGGRIISPNYSFENNESYTVEFWLYSTDAGNNEGASVSIGNLGSVLAYPLYEGTKMFYGKPYVINMTKYASGSWNHIAYVITSTNCTVYINGNLQSSFTRLDSLPISISIGNKGSTSAYGEFRFDELCITSGAKYQSEFQIPIRPSSDPNFEGYKVDDLVVYEDKIYRCIEDNNDVTFTPSKWVEVSKSIVYPDWSSITDYSVDDIVIYQNQLYRCITSHTSTNDFNGDFNKWTPLDKNCFIHNWASNIPYYADEVVKYDDVLYRCKTSHVSTLNDKPSGVILYEATGNTIDIDDTTTIPYSEIIDLGSVKRVTDMDYTESTTDMSFTYTIEVSEDNINYMSWDDVSVDARYIRLTVDSVNIDTGATSPNAHLTDFTAYGDSNNWEKISSGGSAEIVLAREQDIDEMFI